MHRPGVSIRFSRTHPLLEEGTGAGESRLSQSPFWETQAINLKGRQRLWLVEVISLPAASGLDREILSRTVRTGAGGRVDGMGADQHSPNPLAPPDQDLLTAFSFIQGYREVCDIAVLGFTDMR